MIGFNRIGHHGRFGNQLFQYAALRGIAQIHGYKFCIPKSNFKYHNNEWQEHQLFSAFVLPHCKNKNILSANTYEEKQFTYCQNYVDECPDNVNLFGYFQSEKYFLHIADSIREDFTFRPEIVNLSKKHTCKSEQAISLHIRRSDNVNSNSHIVCPMKYYETALSKFDSNLPVLVFSDDINWCKRQDFFKPSRFKIIEDFTIHRRFVDLYLMTQCSHHIIANSSFSWWGAWLSGSDNVISPSRWFLKNGVVANTSLEDLIPDRWTKILID